MSIDQFSNELERIAKLIQKATQYSHVAQGALKESISNGH